MYWNPIQLYFGSHRGHTRCKCREVSKSMPFSSSSAVQRSSFIEKRIWSKKIIEGTVDVLERTLLMAFTGILKLRTQNSRPLRSVHKFKCGLIDSAFSFISCFSALFPKSISYMFSSTMLSYTARRGSLSSRAC